MNNSLLPSVMQDKQNLALEACIKEALKIDVKDIMIYPIENAKQTLLPYLAKENHILGVEGWNLARNEEEKKKLIANAFQMHAKKGSLPSIKEALATINIQAEIEEFWEYCGRPARFQMKFINIYDRPIDEILETKIKELINAYKPATRILDFINYYLCSILNLFISANMKSYETVVIRTQEEVI